MNSTREVGQPDEFAEGQDEDDREAEDGRTSIDMRSVVNREGGRGEFGREVG